MDTLTLVSQALASLGELAKLANSIRESKDKERKQADDAVKALPPPPKET